MKYAVARVSYAIVVQFAFMPSLWNIPDITLIDETNHHRNSHNCLTALQQADNYLLEHKTNVLRFMEITEQVKGYTLVQMTIAI